MTLMFFLQKYDWYFRDRGLGVLVHDLDTGFSGMVTLQDLKGVPPRKIITDYYEERMIDSNQFRGLVVLSVQEDENFSTTVHSDRNAGYKVVKHRGCLHDAVITLQGER